jgi:RND family efflux transporter MFP subunit
MKRYFVFSIAVSLVGTSLAAEPLIPMTAEQQQGFGITVAAPEPADEVYGDKLPAKVVVPNAQLHVVSALQGGLIETLFVAVGDDLKQGQTLARIQSPDLLELQRDLLQTLAQLHLARTNLDRDQQLAKDGIIAQRRLLETQVAHQELATQLMQQREALHLAGMSRAEIQSLEQRRRLISTLTVTAPHDGVVLEQMAVAGQRVDATAPLYRIGNLKPLWIDIHIPLERTQGVAIGDKVLVPQLQVEGLITTLGRDVHEEDQGVLIRAEVNEGAERLRPGQFVEVQISGLKSREPHYRVPRTALIRHEQKTLVFVQIPEGFAPSPVDVVNEQGDQVTISATFSADVRIAKTGTAALKAVLTGSSEGGH